MVEDDGSEDKFPYHPSDLPDVDWYLQENFDKVLEVITTIKNAGNKFYKEKNYQKAVQKYKKSCRYIEHLRTCMGATEDSEEGTFFSFSNIISSLPHSFTKSYTLLTTPIPKQRIRDLTPIRASLAFFFQKQSCRLKNS